jgi:hypothetical protein
VHITFERDGDTDRLRRMIRVASRKNFRRIRIAALIIFICGVSLLAIDVADDSNPFVGSLCVFLGLFYALFVPWIGVRKQTRRLTPIFAEPARYTITDVDVTVHNESATSVQRWPGFSKIREVDGFWICNNKAGVAALMIPQDCMRPEDVTTLRQFFAEHSLAPAEYRIG